MTAPGLLALDRLSRSFGALSAVNGVSLEVAPRERRAIIGPNGAGKTTLFNLITGHLAPSGGRVLLGGMPITGLAPHALARRGLARSFQRNNLFPRLSVLENLRLAAAADGRGSWSLLGSVSRLTAPLARARETAEAVGLAERLDVLAAALSYGEQRHLEVLLALAGHPRLLLLDEPAAGLSPGERREMARFIKGLDSQLTILLIEHDMDVAFEIVETITVLHFGCVVAQGSKDEVRANPSVQSAWP
jgi:branched-chain amino acid transport system ATP-binding protein